MLRQPQPFVDYEFSTLFLVLSALSAPFMLVGMLWVIKERHTFPLSGRSIPLLVPIGIVQICTSVSFCIRQVYPMNCGHVLLFHVNLMHVVFVAFNLRMFRLWFSYRYAQEQLAKHQDPGFEFSSFSGATSTGTGTNSGTGTASPKGSSRSVTVSVDGGGGGGTGSGRSDSHSGRRRSVGGSGSGMSASGMSASGTTTEGEEAEGLGTSLSPRVQRYCNKHRHRRNASTWFHKHRVWVKTRTLLILLVVVTLPLIAATNFWYIGSPQYDASATDPNCLAFDEIRPLSTVLAGTFMLVIVFTSYSIRHIADGFEIQQELKLTSLTIFIILPFNALNGRISEPFPILSLLLWLLFVIFFSVTFFVPLYKVLKRKRSCTGTLKPPRRRRSKSRRRNRSRSRSWASGRRWQRQRSRSRYGDSGGEGGSLSGVRAVTAAAAAAAATTNDSRRGEGESGGRTSGSGSGSGGGGGGGTSSSVWSIESSRSRQSEISLMDILTDDRYRKLRLDFELQLSKEFAVENIMFFQAVRDFEQSADDLSDGQTRNRALDIYRRFIKKNAAYETNLPMAIVRGVEAVLAPRIDNFYQRLADADAEDTDASRSYLPTPPATLSRSSRHGHGHGGPAYAAVHLELEDAVAFPDYLSSLSSVGGGSSSAVSAVPVPATETPPKSGGGVASRWSISSFRSSQRQQQQQRPAASLRNFSSCSSRNAATSIPARLRELPQVARTGSEPLLRGVAVSCVVPPRTMPHRSPLPPLAVVPRTTSVASATRSTPTSPVRIGVGFPPAPLTPVSVMLPPSATQSTPSTPTTMSATPSNASAGLSRRPPLPLPPVLTDGWYTSHSRQSSPKATSVVAEPSAHHSTPHPPMTSPELSTTPMSTLSRGSQREGFPSLSKIYGSRYATKVSETQLSTSPSFISSVHNQINATDRIPADIKINQAPEIVARSRQVPPLSAYVSSHANGSSKSSHVPHRSSTKAPAPVVAAADRVFPREAPALSSHAHTPSLSVVAGSGSGPAALPSRQHTSYADAPSRSPRAIAIDAADLPTRSLTRVPSNAFEAARHHVYRLMTLNTFQRWQQKRRDELAALAENLAETGGV